MKLFAAGIETETNSFSPIPTAMEDFSITRMGEHADGSSIDEVPFTQWQQQAASRNDIFTMGLYACACPAGLTTRATYEQLRSELLADLQNCGAVDVVLLCLHGAMMADGYPDCEGDLLKHIRHSVGPTVVIAAELDLHGHLTDQMLDYADLLISFKEYPHTDMAERGIELYDLAVNTHLGRLRPTMAVFDCHMVGMYPTSTAVMRRFINRMFELEARDDILSVSFIHGFPFGDMPEAGAKMLVISDGDAVLAEQVARQLGQEIFCLRHSIGFASLGLELALNKAVGLSESSSRDGRPIVVADQSDNAGGGAPADATFALRWLLENTVQSVAMAIFYDPQVVKLAIAAGIGATLPIRLGGKMGKVSGDPVDLVVTVQGIQKNYYHQFPQAIGQPLAIPIGDVVALHSCGIDLVVSSLRSQCFCPDIFADLNVDYNNKRIVVIKSSQHFYSAFAPVAQEIIYMAGPGAVSPMVKNIAYQKMPTDNKYPWIENSLSTASGDASAKESQK